MNYYVAGSAVAFQTQRVPFTIAAGGAANLAVDRARMTAENAWLNRPIGAAGSLYHFMAAQGGAPARVAAAAAGGALKVRSCFVRSDSAAAVNLAGGGTTTDVAYAMGVVDAPGTFTNTLIAQPSAAGWRWPAHPDTVYLNATPVPGGGHRTLAELSEFLAHEGIHAADRDAGAPGEWDRYATEFRAYWIGGLGAGQSTALDPTMSGMGPKSERARTIFNHLYGSATYPFVQPAYDQNEQGFRERADNYLYPDGINLTLSPQLAALRAEVESYSGVAADYPAKRAAIIASFAAVPGPDRGEVRGNRDWRDLVETKFTTRAVAGVAPPISERNDIKTLLGIPR
ncbi:MAG: hypothetical protein R3B06_14995 [Kofleriaceae bacterium]